VRAALRAGALVAGLALVALAGLAPASSAQDDEFDGLPPGLGQEDTYYACNVCHSIRLVTQQRLSRERWDELLDWMVEKQGMPPLPEEDRALVLGYLAEHFNPAVPR
jgi:hypothetical protein